LKADPIPPSALRWLASLPARHRQTIAGAVPILVQGIADLEAIAVVGSLAEGTYDQQSDTDFLLVRSLHTGDKSVQGEVKRRYDPVNFIVASSESLLRNFQQGTDAAWSVRRAAVVYDPEGVLSRYTENDPPPPSHAWIASRLAAVAQWKETRVLHGKVLSLAQLLLAARWGTLPTTKVRIRQTFLEHVDHDLVRQALNLILQRRPSLEFTPSEAHLLEQAASALQEMVSGALTDSG
jgi:hypothetical protein